MHNTKVVQYNSPFPFYYAISLACVMFHKLYVLCCMFYVVCIMLYVLCCMYYVVCIMLYVYIYMTKHYVNLTHILFRVSVHVSRNDCIYRLTIADI